MTGGGLTAAAVVTAVVLMLTVAAGQADAALTCLKGTVPLTTTADRSWCMSGGDEDACVLEFSFNFDAASPSGSRWPLTAYVSSDTGHNRTLISAMFPELADIAFQCSTTGDVLATTRSGANNERLRFMWRYGGVSSFSCSYTFDSVDLTADFLQFTALFSYSGRVSTFDASFTSNDVSHSIGQLSSAFNCPAGSVAASTTGGSGSTATPSPSGGGGGATTSSCIISDCRYPQSAWKTGSLKKSVTWKAVQGKALCGISYHDLMFRNTADIRQMGPNWLADARELITCELNAAQSACPLPTNLEYVAELSAYLHNPLNCGQNLAHAEWLASMRAWNDQTAVCEMLKTSGGANAEDTATTTAGHVSSNGHLSKRDTTIVIVACVAGGVCLIGGCLLCCIALCICTPVRFMLVGLLPTRCFGCDCFWIQRCCGAPFDTSHPLMEKPGMRRYVDPGTMQENRLVNDNEPLVPPSPDTGSIRVMPFSPSDQPPIYTGQFGNEIVTAAHPLAAALPNTMVVHTARYYGSGSYATGTGQTHE